MWVLQNPCSAVNRPQAKWISDDEILAALEASARPWGASMSCDVYDEFPQYPYKVVLAKLRSAYKRGLVDGCPCGCRGDWRVVRKTPGRP